jgi:hypothetical protein
LINYRCLLAFLLDDLIDKLDFLLQLDFIARNAIKVTFELFSETQLSTTWLPGPILYRRLARLPTIVEVCLGSTFPILRVRGAPEVLELLVPTTREDLTIGEGIVDLSLWDLHVVEHLVTFFDSTD